MVVELRARFDEEANLSLADRLQEAGVQVMYGVVGYKTHAKMMLIVRREGKTLRRYVHLGTGNYHAGTARAVHRHRPDDRRTRKSAPTCTACSSSCPGLAPAIKLKRLMASPFTLHAGLLKRIEREATLARAGKPARIIAKMNALNEPSVIRALYAASQAGVRIDLIVRGACCLRPGVPGRVGEHPRALGGRPLPRAQPRVLVRQRRHAGDLLLQRRLDGAQPAAPRRDLLPDPRSGAGAARASTRNWPTTSPTTSRPGGCTPTAATARRSPATAKPPTRRRARCWRSCAANEPRIAATTARRRCRRRAAGRGRPRLQQLPHGGGALRARAAAHRRPHQGTRAPGRGPRRPRRARARKRMLRAHDCLARFGQRLARHPAAARARDRHQHGAPAAPAAELS